MTKVLLVDDSRAVRLVGNRVMSAFGFETFQAEQGEAALNQIFPTCLEEISLQVSLSV